jgi:carboxyl-terminal processing protease
MPRANLLWIITLSALVGLGVLLNATAPAPEKDYQLIRSIVDVLAKVDENYVRELNADEKKKLVEAMISQGLEKLDEHSQYFNKEQLEAFDSQTEGQFGGIGVLLNRDTRSQLLRVDSPVPGTPAFEAGIYAGDVILKVDDKSLESLGPDEVRGMIKGKPGTKVKLTIGREGSAKPLEFELTRAIIEIHAVKGVRRNPADPTTWEWFADPQDKIALIRLVAFSEKTEKELKAAVLDAEKQGARAIILDMRNNPGGLLSQAASVCDLFLNDGVIVSTGDKRGSESKAPRRTFDAKPGDTIFEPALEKPMAVLINRNSASASEIVAAALQDHKRAIVVGERSFGKGSVQKIFNLPTSQAAVKLTTEVWLTPQGKNIHRWPDSKETDEWGVKPDAGYEVKLSDTQILEYYQHLSQLEMIQGKNLVNKEAKPFTDPVLEKAMQGLRAKLAAIPPKGA